jgi:hypothetical protein
LQLDSQLRELDAVSHLRAAHCMHAPPFPSGVKHVLQLRFCPELTLGTVGVNVHVGERERGLVHVGEDRAAAHWQRDSGHARASANST